MAQGPNRLEPLSPGCGSAGGTIDDGRSTATAPRSSQHSLPNALHVRLYEFDAEFLQLSFYVLDWTAVEVETIPKPLRGEIAGGFGIGSGAYGIGRQASQFLRKSGRGSGFAFQSPDLFPDGVGNPRRKVSQHLRNHAAARISLLYLKT